MLPEPLSYGDNHSLQCCGMPPRQHFNYSDLNHLDMPPLKMSYSDQRGLASWQSLGSRRRPMSIRRGLVMAMVMLLSLTAAATVAAQRPQSAGESRAAAANYTIGMPLTVTVLSTAQGRHNNLMMLGD